jgi:hypothetical protein
MGIPGPGTPPPRQDHITGRTHFEVGRVIRATRPELEGQPVVVLVRWNGKGPRNVWIRRSDGTETIRPFRGLRRRPPP